MIEQRLQGKNSTGNTFGKKYKNGLSINDNLERLTFRVLVSEKEMLKQEAIEKGITLNELIKRKLKEIIK